jgi:hypothetical protein
MMTLGKLIGYISIAGVASVLLFLYRWFLRTTDMEVGYNWSWKGTSFYPNFDLRNRSGSAVVLANIAYTRHDGKEMVAIDNKSLWGQELKPGTIAHVSTTPVPGVHSMQDCLAVEVTVRLQNGRQFRGQGPGQLYTGYRRYAFALRNKVVRSSLPLPS